MVLILVLLHNWKTTRLECVLAYPQALVTKEIYMENPKGFELEYAKTRNIYYNYIETYMAKINLVEYGIT